MLWVLLLLALPVGLLLGLLGGGGSILAVPVLTYAGGMEPGEAIAGSLFVVGTTSLVAAGLHGLKGSVAWRTGLLFGAASMVGALAGGMVGGRLPGVVLMIGFALIMLVSAWKMIRPKRPARDARAAGPGTGDDDAATPAPPARTVRVLAQGLGVGLITGLVGAGGGFMVVPALVLLSGLSMPVAVGTSLLVIALNSFAGLAGHALSTPLDWGVLLPVTGVTVAAAVVGVLLAHRVPARTLKTVFGWFVLVMGVLILAQQVLGLAV